jgi:hypothetical protein
MAPGAEPAEGPEAIEELMEGALEAAGGSQMNLKPVEVMSGRLAPRPRTVHRRVEECRRQVDAVSRHLE